MIGEAEIVSALKEADFGPLSIEVDTLQIKTPSGKKVDAYIKVRWNESDRLFIAEFKRARSMRDIRNASWQLKSYIKMPDQDSILVVPYLTNDAMKYLREEKINVIDLSGNGTIEVAGEWSYFRQGLENRYPTGKVSRSPYRGKSALVGRIFMMRPMYSGVSEVQAEIEGQSGKISLSQVSKVLTAMEEDLIIKKSAGEIRLIQPEKLLDSLIEGYRRPRLRGSLLISDNPTAVLFARLLERANSAGTKIAAYDPGRYIIAPESSEILQVYVRASAATDLAQLFQMQPADRFVKIEIMAIDEASLFLDAIEEEGFLWCSNLEVYLRLMQGGKRETESAAPIRNELLNNMNQRLGS